MTITLGSLFAGIGGLDDGVTAAVADLLDRTKTIA